MSFLSFNKSAYDRPMRNFAPFIKPLGMILARMRVQQHDFQNTTPGAGNVHRMF
jgi:hypothetical protein